MTESFNLIRRVGSLEVSPVVHNYSSVKIYGGQNADGTDRIFQLGDESGATFEITNEWGSAEQAANILPIIKGFKYQAYESGTVRLDPAAELGDAVTIANTFGGIFSKRVRYGSDIVMSLEAPSKEEVEHEFQVQSPTDRQYARFTSDVRSKFTIQAEAIEARVEKVHGKTTENFWWSLQSDGWSVGNQNGAIFKVNSSGAEVEGEIRATSGNIGGLTIEKNRLSSGNLDFGGEVNDGVYLGPKGIQCGSASTGVQLTSDGNLYAENGYFRGNVSAGKIDYGGNDGYFSGSGLVTGSVTGGSWGQISAGGTVEGVNLEGGINTSLGYADDFHYACDGTVSASTFYAETLYASSLSTGDIVMQYGRYIYSFTPDYIYYLDQDGNKAQTLVLRL